MAEVVSGKRWTRTKHLQLISDATADFITRTTPADILLLNCPPRHGKSELISHWLPVWILDRDPTARIGLASYEAGVAGRFGGKVRDTLTDHPHDIRARVSRRSSARSSWVTTEGGGMITAGVGGPFTSHGFDLMIFDDLYKNWQQANSPVWRTTLKNWFKSTAFTRLEPGGLIIVPMTRWHEDDIIDVLRETGLSIKELKLPALATKGDILGREPGEALWPERYDRKRLLQIKEAVGPRIWASVYQQDPQPDEGEIFRRDQFRYWRHETNGGEVFVLGALGGVERRVSASGCVRFGTVDLSIKQKEVNDWIVFAAWVLTITGDLLLADVLRFKAEFPDQIQEARAFYMRNGLSFLTVEDAGYQSAFIQTLRRGSDGVPPLPVREFHPGKFGDKVARSRSSQVVQENGRLYWLAGAHWLSEWEAEHLSFPGGKHDDQVDTESMAVIEVISGHVGTSAQKIKLDLEARPSSWRF